MSILLSKDTKVLVQGLTGKEGSFHARIMREYGTRIVAGVTPGKGGQKHEGTPVFDSVAEAREATGAEASIVFVPRAAAADSVVEAIGAGLSLIVCTTDGIPVHDMLRVRSMAREAGCVLIGPNCPGIISPGRAKLGFMPSHVYAPGPVGVISRSGTLSYEVSRELTLAGVGQSTVAVIGGDLVKGSGYVDLLLLFRADSETGVIVLLGEIGGDEEERAAKWLRENELGKPVVAYIVGRTAPPFVRMGHPGTVFVRDLHSFERKVMRLADAGVHVAASPWEAAALAKRLAGDAAGRDTVLPGA